MSFPRRQLQHIQRTADSLRLRCGAVGQCPAGQAVCEGQMENCLSLPDGVARLLDTKLQVYNAPLSNKLTLAGVLIIEGPRSNQ
jgi:hypothetical protein